MEPIYYFENIFGLKIGTSLRLYNVPLGNYSSTNFSTYLQMYMYVSTWLAVYTVLISNNLWKNLFLVVDIFVHSFSCGQKCPQIKKKITILFKMKKWLPNLRSLEILCQKLLIPATFVRKFGRSLAEPKFRSNRN